VLPDGSSQRVGITRAHLEEDAGAASAASSFHTTDGTATLSAWVPATTPCPALSIQARACTQKELPLISQQTRTMLMS
jgi:Asp-tRNA(Asn)/Glu-tRNA(Gln) amidotransferase B subunit